jgi:hypothetical protein
MPAEPAGYVGLPSLRELRAGAICLEHLPGVCRLGPAVETLDVSGLVGEFGWHGGQDAVLQEFQPVLFRRLGALRQLLVPAPTVQRFPQGVLEDFKQELAGVDVVVAESEAGGEEGELPPALDWLSNESSIWGDSEIDEAGTL